MKESGSLNLIRKLLVPAALVAAAVWYISATGRSSIVFNMVCERYPLEAKSYPITAAKITAKLEKTGKRTEIVLDKAGIAKCNSANCSVDYDAKTKTCRWEWRGIRPGDYSVTLTALDAAGKHIGVSTEKLAVAGEDATNMDVNIPAFIFNEDSEAPGPCDLSYWHNAAFSDGRKTFLRWGKSEIAIFTGGIPPVEAAVAEWQNALGRALSLKITDDPEKADVVFAVGGAVDEKGAPGCGNAEGYDTFTRATIHLSPEGFQNCPPRKQIAMHELGHALGFFGHAKGNRSLMADSDSEWRKMDSVDGETAATMDFIYKQSPGATLDSAGCGF